MHERLCRLCAWMEQSWCGHLCSRAAPEDDVAVAHARHRVVVSRVVRFIRPWLEQFWVLYVQPKVHHPVVIRLTHLHASARSRERFCMHATQVDPSILPTRLPVGIAASAEHVRCKQA